MRLLERMRRRRIGEAGRRAEKAAVKRLKGKPTPASGAAGVNSDFVAGEFRFENKSTRNQSISLSYRVLVDTARRARIRGDKPALSFQFTTEGGRLLDDGAWVLIPESVFRELVCDDESE